MNRASFSCLALFLAAVLFAQDSHAQDYTRLGLPDGAIARLNHMSAVTSVAFSPDGGTLASGSGDVTFGNSGDDTVRLWDVASDREQATLEGHTSGVRSVSFSPDGKTLASGSDDNTVRLWDVASGQEKDVLEGHTGEVTSVAFSPDGRTLASGGGSWDETIRLWDVATGREKAVLEGNTTQRSVSFSPDGKTLASGGGYSADPVVQLWDVASGQKKATLEGHGNFVTAVAFSPDGQTLASAGADNTVLLWDVANGQQNAEFVSSSNGTLHSVLFSPDGTTLAIGAHDGRVWLWDAGSGEEMALEGHTSDVLSVAFSPDGRTLASGSDDGTVLLWDMSPWAGSDPDGSTDEERQDEISGHRPDELIGKWKSDISGDEADTTRVLQFDADGGFISSDKVTSHASMKQSLIMEWGADPARVQSVADSLAARKSRFHEALVADKQVFATELRGAWGVDGNVVQAIVDSFSMSLNGLQGKDVFEFYEEIIPLVVPSENAGLVGFLLLGFALIQEVFDALIEEREVFGIGIYSIENDDLVVIHEETPVRYSRVTDMITPDFDGDGTVGFPDFLQFAANFGLSQGDTGYDARFDLDGDGSVAFSDFLIFAGSFGKGA